MISNTQQELLLSCKSKVCAFTFGLWAYGLIRSYAPVLIDISYMGPKGIRQGKRTNEIRRYVTTYGTSKF